MDRSFRLASKPGNLGVGFNDDGVSLAGARLLRKTADGFAPRSPHELGELMKTAYRGVTDIGRLSAGLDVIAKALNRGERGRAMIAALQLQLDELSWDDAVRVARIESALAKYNPDEPRDWHGRWTTSGDARQSRPTKPTVSTPSASTSTRVPSPAARLNSMAGAYFKFSLG